MRGVCREERVRKDYAFAHRCASGAAVARDRQLFLWRFRRLVEAADRGAGKPSEAASRPQPIDLVPDSRRIMALIVIFLIVIVFWMLFHQNQTTWTYWANDNTDWTVSGVISCSASRSNPAWMEK